MAPPSDGRNARGFAADAETERALRAGLAGRDAAVQRGRLDAAIRTLAAEPATKLVFFDLDGAPEPETAVRKLASVCAFGTVMIAIGSADTAHLTRTLLRGGVADYLVKPVAPADVREASAAALGELPERPYAGRVIAFAGSAGSGVSTLVAVIARAIARNGRVASVLDLDPISGPLSLRLGAEPAGDLAALLASLDPGEPSELEESPLDSGEPFGLGEPVGPEEIDGVCAPAGPGLLLVGYPPSGPTPAAPGPRAVQALVEGLANRAHAVLVSGSPDPEVRLEAMRRADTRVLLYEPHLLSISEAARCLALLGREHPAVLVQCCPRARKGALSSAQIRYALAERRPDVVIPFDRALHAASTRPAKARSIRPGKAWRKALRQVIERVIEGPSLAPS